MVAGAPFTALRGFQYLAPDPLLTYPGRSVRLVIEILLSINHGQIAVGCDRKGYSGAAVKK
jgi:hypothetical protein